MKMRLSLLQRLMKQPSSSKLITMKNTKMNLEANKLKKLHKQQKNQKIGFNKITLRTKGLLKLKERKKLIKLIELINIIKIIYVKNI